MDTFLFHLFNLVNIVATLTEMSLSHLGVIFQVEIFSYCILTETFAIGFQNWFDH